MPAAPDSSDSARFDGAALYAALDAERQRRGWSWRQVASEVGVSAPTLRRTQQGGGMETDGILCMTRWLGRPPEAFSQTNHHLAGTEMLLASGVAGVVRLDTRALHRAVDELRRSQALSWQALATELRATSSQLTRLSKGGRIGIRLLLTVLAWLGRSAESFAHITDR